MPLRSPKMYFCIFGFHRLVWWPKCTPASRSSFIVRAAMVPPSVVPPPRSGSPGVPPKWRGVRDGRLRRVLRVDAYVLLAEIAREDVGQDRKSTRLNSSHGYISYAVFCLKKKNPIFAQFEVDG